MPTLNTSQAPSTLVKPVPSYFCNPCGCWHHQGAEDFMDHMPALIPPRPEGLGLPNSNLHRNIPGLMISKAIVLRARQRSHLPVDALPVINEILDEIEGELSKVREAN